MPQASRTENSRRAAAFAASFVALGVGCPGDDGSSASESGSTLAATGTTGETGATATEPGLSRACGWLVLRTFR